MNHPDDAQALRQWPLSGPRNENIADLVAMIADHWIRLSIIEARIVFTLAEWLDEISRQQSKDTDNGRDRS